MGRRVVSGMRPTGGLHIGHLRGVLHNWQFLQDSGDECFFFVADWHALTSDYAAPEDLRAHGRRMVTAWLASGIDSSRATLFLQSDVPAHAELCVLLSMICPLSWLMHLPTYKEQQHDLDTLGFLCYPLLQSADIMIYGADCVPVGEDQLPHVEFTRSIARRFNRFYGRSESFRRLRAEVAVAIGDVAERQLRAQQIAFGERGDKAALQSALVAIDGFAVDAQSKQTLRDDLCFGGEAILRPPEPLLTQTPKLPGTDGRKMSKSYDNAIDLFDEPAVVDGKIARMQTDPARIRRSDKGEPTRCPVWQLHGAFSDDDTRAWVQHGCRSAEIGCVQCKKKLTEFVCAELLPISVRRAEVEKSGAVDDILSDGAKRARAAAAATLETVRGAMRI